MFTKKSIRDIDIDNKTILLRVDYNVPINEFGVVADDYRIRQTLATIEYARAKGSKIIIIAHLGRPGGKVDDSLSLAPVAVKLSDLLHLPVEFMPDCIGQETAQKIKGLPQKSVIMLENLRFYPQEESNDTDFAQKLASLADIFVQDGFGVAYRKHASVEAITHFLPSVAGLLLEKEANTIMSALEDPKKPLAVVVGGLKVSDKIKMIKKFIESADYVAVIGAMANTFLAAEGVKIGKSLYEPECIDIARSIIEKAKNKAKSQHFVFYLPKDVVVATNQDAKSPTRVVDIGQHTWADITSYPKMPDPQAYTVQDDEIILDIGPMSAACIAGSLQISKTVLFNGLAGVTEIKGINGAPDPFAHGTSTILSAVTSDIASHKDKPLVIVGGGDTVAYVESVAGLRERLGYVSTGGGAALELMSGNQLIGVESLLDKNSNFEVSTSE